MTTKHTEGPWMAERHGQVTAMVAGHRRQVASTTGDAVMHGDHQTDVISLQMANARIIASAPDLLAALKAAFEFHRPDCERLEFVDSPPPLDCDCGYDRAHRAIARAEGAP